MTRSRVLGLAAVALVFAVAATFIVMTRAGAQQAVTSVSVSPSSATNLVGTTHTLTATVFPAQGATRIRLQVLSGPNANDTASAVTGANGQATLSYLGDGGTGTDAILVWADLDLDGVRDLTEPQTAAIKQWVTTPVTGISLSPSSATNTVGTTHEVTATVLPAQAGVIVRFRVVSGPNVGDPRIATTNAQGQALFSYQGTGGIGVDAILAWADLNRNHVVDGNEPRATATKTWTASSTGGLSISPSTDTNPQDTLHTVTATLTPIQANVLVRFSVTSGPNSSERGVALTDTVGQARYSYLGDGGVGTDVILAWADIDQDGQRDSGEPSAIATKQWVSTVAPSIALSPANATNLVGTAHTVRATVSPVAANVVVRLRVTSGPHTGSGIRVLTNASGQASFSYVGTAAGTDGITGWIDADDDGLLDSGEARAFAGKVWTAVSPAAGLTVTPAESVGAFGTAHTLNATVSPAQSGRVVRFRVTVGPNQGDTGVATTNSVGNATLAYVGNGGIGTDVILTWIDLNGNTVLDSTEPQRSVLRHWVSSAGVTSLSVAPGFDSKPVNTQQSVTATVSPAQANAIVRFRVTQGPNANETGVGITNANGQTTFSYVGDGGVGSDLVLAWADLDGDGNLDANEPQAAAIKQWTAVAASSFGLTPVSATNAVGTKHSLTASVGPAQRDLRVRFEVTAGPNAGTKGSDETDSNGRATFSYRGDEGAGTDLIVAWLDLDRDGRLDANEPQATAVAQWTPVQVTGLSLSPASDESRAGKKHELTARVSPRVSGVLVRFQILSGPNIGETSHDRTDGNGRAEFEYRGDGGAGTDLILAWADLDEDGVIDPGEPQASASERWTSNGSSTSVAAVCASLNSNSHPSLPVLCNLVLSGQLPANAEAVISQIILERAAYSHRGGNPHQNIGYFGGWNRSGHVRFHQKYDRGNCWLEADEDGYEFRYERDGESLRVSFDDGELDLRFSDGGQQLIVQTDDDDDARVDARGFGRWGDDEDDDHDEDDDD